MKKAELKEGVRYYVDSSNRVWGGKSYHQTAEFNSRNRFTIVFQNGQPETYENKVRVRSEATQGTKWVQLAHVRGEWASFIKNATDEKRRDIARWNDRGRKYQEHLERKAKRERAEREKGTRQAFAQIINGSDYLSDYKKVTEIKFEVMQYIVEAVQAYEANNPQKVSA